MSKDPSLEIRKDLLIEARDIADSFQLSQLDYINEAISYYNKLSKRKIQIQRLQGNSISGAGQSSSIVEEMKKLQDSHFIL